MIRELSIIIPCLNEQAYLPRLLESISKQAYDGKLQVIVVDGHSEDRTVAEAKKYQSRLDDLTVVEAERNVGHQRNAGAKHAKYEHLLFLDADVVLPPDLLARLLKKAPANKKIIVCTMHTAAHMNLADRGLLVVAYLLLFASRAARIPAINGDFILTTKSSHNGINGFVEGALLGEDTDYGLRSFRAGAKYRYYLWPQVIASERRIRKMGRYRLLALWVRAYLKVLKHGPIFPNEGFEYPFGHYGSKIEKHDRV
jgi:glycosyltransferase involved in cell wall biosynthesis